MVKRGVMWKLIILSVALIAIPFAFAQFCDYNVSQTISSNVSCTNILVQSGVTLTMSGTISMSATENFTIESGATLDADGEGFGSGTGPGVGNRSYNTWIGAGGGSYGGMGQARGSYLGGATYGDSFTVTEPGSSGGLGSNAGHTPGRGGGLLVLQASNLILNGTITSDGLNGQNLGFTTHGAPGGGSGGGIFINTSTLSGSGTLTANGGPGGTSGWGSRYGGHGGGGRILVRYQSNTFDGTAQANEGGSGAGKGSVVFAHAANDSFETSMFVVDQATYDFDSITVTDGYIRFEQDSILSLTNITFENVTTISNTPYPNISIQTQTLTLNNSQIAYLRNLSINATDVTIDSQSSINADATGATSASGTGAGGSSASTWEGGAGGGFGAQGQTTGYVGGSRYGGAFIVNAVGSGGGAGTGGYSGAAGGGLITITAQNTTIDGNITANGGTGASANTNTFGSGGGGSGGGILIHTTNLYGSGTISALGGNGGASSWASRRGGAGSGGRILLKHFDAPFNGTLDASGGTFRGNAPAGTIARVNLTDDLHIGESGFALSSTDLTGNSWNVGSFRIGNVPWSLTQDTIYNLSFYGNMQGELDANNYAFRVYSPNITVATNISSASVAHFRYSTLFNDSGAAYNNVPVFLERDGVAGVNFSSISASNISEHITLSENFVRVNSSAAPELNVSSVVVLYTDFTTQPTAKWDPEDDGTFEDCPPTVCTVLSFNETTGEFRFSVAHFTAFSSGFDSELTIYDSGDPEGGSFTILENQVVDFVANYTNATSGSAILGACNITIDTLSVTNVSMSFNVSGTSVYEYNDTFPIGGDYNWSVDCTNAGSFANLSATDTITITQIPQAVPEFSDFVLMILLGVVGFGLVIIRRK